MENKQKIYYNNSACTGAERGTRKEHKVLRLRFSAYDKVEKKQTAKWFTMFLTEENNERNQDVLRSLGVERPPERVTYEAVQELQGLGMNTVDLVCEVNDAGYENVKFINKPRFGVRVFDMRASSGSGSDNPF